MKLIDLTMPLSEVTPTYSGTPGVVIEMAASLDRDGYEERRLTLTSHVGTHVDAPAHMAPNGKRLSDFDLARFVSGAWLFDVRGQKEIDVDLAPVNAGEIVLLRTDYSNGWRSPEYWRDTPVVSARLAKALVDRRVGMVGIDSWSIDKTPYDIHQKLLGAGVLILENLVGLAGVGKPHFRLWALPLNVQGTDGAPCRVVAEVD